MLTMKLAGLTAAGAIAALVGAVPAAQAQIAPPPDRVDVYMDTPHAEPGDYNWSAQRNVVESDRYERLTHTNPAFRAARIRRECGSVSEPYLHQQCVASFY